MKYRAKDATAENTYVKKFTVSSEKAKRTAAKTACEGATYKNSSLIINA